MKSLEKYTDEQLQTELERREALKDVPPLPLPAPNWLPLTNYLVLGIQETADKGFPPEDFEQCTFEYAMTAVFGPDIWSWWNKKMGG